MKHPWDEALAKLKQERDELALKMHLGRKEAVAEWERLEAKWHDIQAAHRPTTADVDERSVGVGLALELAVDELKKGYERIRKLL